MTAPLLHLIIAAEWRAALDTRVVAPPSLADVGFVHLSTPAQVALPADRLFRGRHDLALLVIDPARLGVEVRWETGLPTDPAGMRFPHAYGAVPTAAVVAVLPYRPGPDGRFAAPRVPPVDAPGRQAVFVPSVLRRAATSELPVAGGWAVLTANVPASPAHNQLLIDGEADAAQIDADADRTLGGHGRRHRQARLTGDHMAGPAQGLAERGWDVERRVGMAAPARGERDGRVECADRAGSADPFGAEEPVVDLRRLAVREDGEVVASCVLTIDGATARVDAEVCEPAHRGRGLGDALLSTAMAVAGDSGCDLVVLTAAATDAARCRYARHGFAEVTRTWSASRGGRTLPRP